MGFEDNPADEDPHGECRQEIHQLRETINRLRVAIGSAVDRLQPECVKVNPSLLAVREATRILERV